MSLIQSYPKSIHNFQNEEMTNGCTYVPAMQPTIMKPLMMGLLFRYDRENTQLEKMF